jgi:hypothetical protein
MANERFIAVGMAIAATADVFTAVACWFIVFMM